MRASDLAKLTFWFCNRTGSEGGGGAVASGQSVLPGGGALGAGEAVQARREEEIHQGTRPAAMRHCD